MEETKKKLKILTLSDDPRMFSGVAIQTRYFIEGLLKTGEFCFVSLAGAVKHVNKQPVVIEPWLEDWKLIPVEGFGDHNLVRSILMIEKPDIVWIMTDPRYWSWLWQIEDEIRAHCPLVYYHVWDNYPVPKYNKPWYDSNDVIVSISKLTEDVVNQVARDSVDRFYIPHTVDSKEYFLYPSEKKKALRKDLLKFAKFEDDSILLFFNNRNARRKHAQTLMVWLSQYFGTHPDSKIRLLMHTNPFDEHGSNLVAILEDFNLQNKIRLSPEKLPSEKMNELYNCADFTINTSDAEGFGMATLESLFAGTPVISTRTGGLVDQFIEGIHGLRLEVESTVVGAQDTPYIYEDRMLYSNFVEVLEKVEKDIEFWRTREKHELCASHALKNFNIEKYVEDWKKVMYNTHEKYGSWETRKNYQPYEVIEV